MVSPKKLARVFAGNLAFAKFGERWRELRVVAREGIFRSVISASTRTPAYI